MAVIVNMHVAKSSLSRLVERALSGEAIVIGRNGQPLVQLVPVPRDADQPNPGRAQQQTSIAPAVGTMREDEAADGR